MKTLPLRRMRRLMARAMRMLKPCTPRESAGIVGFDEEMDGIALNREVHNAKAVAAARALKGALQESKTTNAA